MNVLYRPSSILFAALSACALAACQDASEVPAEGSGPPSVTQAPAHPEVDSQTSEGAAAGPAAEDASSSSDMSASAGKPSAPVTIDYTVIGIPVVGQPVNINLEVSSSLGSRPVTLNYRINDARNLVFPQAQPQRVALAAPADTGRSAQQVTVIPQREGRLYLNVSAEVDTDEGMMLKSIAIPIQVGSAPQQQETNGQLREGADGETVISMPAEETPR